ncbi:MAG: TetR/AcrR family transcriptional regulator [Pseudolysinimonas sp.]
MTSRRTPGERAGLTQADVIAAARALLAERGLNGLSMRSVAHRLEVAPNTLYSHVSDKSALLDAVLNDLVGEIPLARRTLPPREGLETIMLDSFDTLVRYPDLVAVSLARQGSGGPEAWRLGTRMLEHLADAGIGEQDARDDLRVLLTHLMGCAAFATQSDPVARSAVSTIASVRSDYAIALGWLLDGMLREGGTR